MDIAKILIYTHASLGGVALLAGAIALIAKKGRSIHKKSGIVFFCSMLSSAITALIISVLPDHLNPFLFAIGIFSSYFIIAGYRALRFKNKNPKITLDKIISWCMIITCFAMICYPIVLNGKINIILVVFGGVGLIFSIRDLQIFQNAEKLRTNWLKLHLGKMIGGYIAAVTAFAVVNTIFPGIYSWFTPGIIGGIYITYWMKKVSASKLTDP